MPVVPVVLALVCALVLGSCGLKNEVASGTDGGAGSGVAVATSKPRDVITGGGNLGSPTTTTAPGITPNATPTFTPAPASWHACRPTGYECATVEVPLDHTKPDGTKIGLALKRLPASDQAHRTGSLFINPGGPGGSGVQAVVDMQKDFSADVRATFDIVGWDPRGVGGSVPLTCDRGALDFYKQDLSSTHPPASADDSAKAWGALCEKENGAVLPFVGTRDVALDLETLRQAVGDEKLTYAGFSYGTLIGLVYGELFPTHLRAMILDGVVDPTQSVYDSSLSQSVAVEKALNQFIAWCPTKPTTCPLPQGADVAIDQLYALNRQYPLTGSIGGKDTVLSPTMINFAIVIATYESDRWPMLAEAIAAGLKNDGGPLGEMADGYVSEASPSVNLAVNCLDSVNPTGADFQKIVDDTAAQAPRTGVYNANLGIPCEFWPVPAKPLPTSYRLAGSVPIMVWGTTGDNATPYANAVHVSQMLEHAELVTLDANRHAALGENACVTQIQGAYLVAGTMPPPGTHC